MLPNLEKHLKKFVSKSKDTPVLQGVHYAKDGSIIATDKYRAIRVHNAHSMPSATTLHIKTGLPIQGEYPNVSKIIDSVKGGFRVTLNRNEIEKATLAAQVTDAAATKINKKFPMLQMNIKNGVATLDIKEDIDIHVRLSAHFCNVTDAKKEFKVSLNSTFLADAMNVFNDCEKTVDIIFGKSSTDPILFTGNMIDVLILPIRTPN